MKYTQIALIRGINIGNSSKRISMPVLTSLLESLGFEDVRTVINSGNAIYSSQDNDTESASRRIEQAILEQAGFSARTMVLTTRQLAAIALENPLLNIATDLSRMAAAVFSQVSDRLLALPLLERAFEPEILAVGSHAAYLWCPEGFARSPLATALGKVMDDRITSRNWVTMLKLYALTTTEKERETL